jgi:hypothetical protein
VSTQIAFEPDILIKTPDGGVMVIEAKLAISDIASTEEELKRYMIGMHYPFGLLVTPEKVRVYRDLYSSFSPASIKQVEEFDGARIWRSNPPKHESEFEAFVQQWLEGLADFPAESLPPEFKNIVQVFILPAIATGEVRAAHPR